MLIVGKDNCFFLILLPDSDTATPEQQYCRTICRRIKYAFDTLLYFLNFYKLYFDKNREQL